jgi:hypothetical protein
MVKQLYIKNNQNNESNFIGSFENEDAIKAYLAQLYNIVALNENQFLLILNEYNKDGKEISKRHFIGCFETREQVETFLNDGHDIKEEEEISSIKA